MGKYPKTKIFFSVPIKTSSILRFLWLILIFVSSSNIIYSQEDASMMQSDTVYVKAGHFISIEKYIYEINIDTFFVIPDKIKYKIQRNPEYKTQAFYDSLAVKAANKRWTMELYNLLIENEKEEKPKLSVKTQKSEEPFMPYEGLMVRNIYIQKLDVFGPSLTDTSRQPKTWTEKTANKLHIKSADWVIKNNIIIKEGQPIDPYILADNERILRQLPFIHEAKIYVINVEGNVADILVVTKDVWSMAFGITFDGKEEGMVEVWDRNLLGLGREIQYNLHWDTEVTPPTGHEGIFYVKNMYGTFVSGTVNYLDAFDTESYGFDLSRPFYTPNIKYAGGIAAQKINTIKNITIQDTIQATPVDLLQQSFWLGRSFSITSDNRKNIKRSNLVFSASVNQIEHTQRPAVEMNSLYTYHNRLLLLGSVAITHQNFYNSNLVYSFGKTEDIPYGSITQFVIGPEYNEFSTRLYVAGHLSGAKFDRNYNYFFGSFSIGGFSYHGKLHQGVLDTRFNYFTRLYTLGDYKFRHFVKVRYLRGINRFEDEYITLNNNYGIRGFESDSLNNSNKLMFTLESVTFTPLHLYGFQFVFFGFADLGIIGPDNKNIFDNTMYSGFGLGIRIRNEKLAFKTLQFRFAYYPHPPADMKDYLLHVTGGEQVKFDNFYIRKPAVLEYY